MAQTKTQLSNKNLFSLTKSAAAVRHVFWGDNVLPVFQGIKWKAMISAKWDSGPCCA